ncbi:hypothetical protein IW261DRAFT_1588651 [Armillaria novae-zelandiae]|uniref:Uncharacterized protein n=1 Tax=Armillaria novae-zelandiae TaxID=153914 RepID=A0AA39PWL7_9AGAR|nr:hypothetical protein IW261DRAFT_1588651 [Armillaria novae-zelandiae]
MTDDGTIRDFDNMKIWYTQKTHPTNATALIMSNTKEHKMLHALIPPVIVRVSLSPNLYAKAAKASSSMGQPVGTDCMFNIVRNLKDTTQSSKGVTITSQKPRTDLRVAVTRYGADEEQVHRSQRSWRAAVPEVIGLNLTVKDISAKPRALCGELKSRHIQNISVPQMAGFSQAFPAISEIDISAYIRLTLLEAGSFEAWQVFE